MIGDRPIVDPPRLVRGLIGARTGDAVLVVARNSASSTETTTAHLRLPRHPLPRGVPLHDVGRWLLVLVDEESDQRP